MITTSVIDCLLIQTVIGCVPWLSFGVVQMESHWQSHKLSHAGGTCGESRLFAAKETLYLSWFDFDQKKTFISSFHNKEKQFGKAWCVRTPEDPADFISNKILGIQEEKDKARHPPDAKTGESSRPSHTVTTSTRPDTQPGVTGSVKSSHFGAGTGDSRARWRASNPAARGIRRSDTSSAEADVRH